MRSTTLLNVLSWYLCCLFTAILLHPNLQNHEGSSSCNVERGEIIAMPAEVVSNWQQSQDQSVFSVVARLLWGDDHCVASFGG
ncbi:hypothetical protein Scep_028340 [Stephania cephalantha]|uniref:Uncharacterized protein n=1 Tax=Stephania cephalantha TaxID=152367 RepID=A0AAP0EH51_9MAGN